MDAPVARASKDDSNIDSNIGSNSGGGSPIAIVGIGCRFPGGVDGPESFWRLLREGVDAVGEIPADRMDVEGLFDPRPGIHGRISSRFGGYLSNIDELDAEFFGIAPRQAERLDPQHRLLLETSWEALEDAGLDVDALGGSAVGVFVGQWLSDFERRLFADVEGVDFHMTTGSGRYASSGRVSYTFGFTGPSLTIDTACSSSLAAVMVACRSIRAGESAMAIAGGVNVILDAHISVAYSESRMMAADGQCKFGDARGDGYVRSEGCGVVVLRPLADAIASGDRIYAVIRGGALNNDGRTSGSLGTPSREGQRTLLRRAYADAGVAPQRVRYVEAHGTGTRAGDPVEIESFGSELGRDRKPGDRFLVGSVKTNIGHTEGAAGLAGLIKCALALYHDAIPPSLHFEQPNPAIAWDSLPLDIPRALSPWPAGDGPRVAGVSAFGIAGTNGHVVLEEAPRTARPASIDDGGPYALPLSARSVDGLRALTERYADLLGGPDAPQLRDVCVSASRLRTALPARAVFVAESADELIDRLRRFGAGEDDAAQAFGQAPEERRARVAFVFPGQGAQWIGMGRELMARSPVFCDAIVACEAAMSPFVDWSLREQLACDAGDPRSRMNDIAVIQPVLVAVEIALAALWRSWGVEAEAVIGHSMGEVGAAYVAGALTLDDAMRIICRRSALMRRTSGQGAMGLVGLSLGETEERLAPWRETLSIAVVNAPQSTVVSGDPAALRALLESLEAEGVFCRQVKVDVASHSTQMDPLVPELVASLATIHPRASAIAMYSTVTGARIDGETLGASYWGRNLRERVRFKAAVQAAAGDGLDVVIELSPHPVLVPAIQQSAAAIDQSSSAEHPTGSEQRIVATGSLRREEPEWAAMLAAAGALWVGGYAVNWAAVMPGAFERVALPRYPWQRQRYWHPAAELRRGGSSAQRAEGGRHPLLGNATSFADKSFRIWQQTLDTGRTPWLGAHAVFGVTVLPASAILELFLSAAATVFDEDGVELTDVRFEHVTHFADDRADIQVQCVVRGGRAELSLWVRVNDDWRRHACGWAAPLNEALRGAPDAPSQAAGPRDAFRERTTDAVQADAFYASLAEAGAAYVEPLRSVKRVRSIGGAMTADIVATSVDVADSAWLVPPAVVDGCLQIAVASSASTRSSTALAMPRGIARVRARKSSAGASIARATHRESAAGGVLADVSATSDAGVTLELEGISLQPISGEGSAISPDPARWLYELDWEQTALPDESVAESWMIVGAPTDATRALAATFGAESEVVPFSAALSGVLPRQTKTGAPWRGVIALATLDDAAAGSGSDATLDRATRRVNDVLALLRAIDRGDLAGRPRLSIVTRGAEQVASEDAPTLALDESPLWGLARAIEAEHSDIFGAAIDLDPRRDVAEQSAALARLLARVGGDTSAGERWLALRGDAAFVARLRAAEIDGERTEWTADGTWLITGGLGGVGVHVGEWLVARGARRLLVLGRSDLPDRVTWNDPQLRTADRARVRAFLRLEAAGAEVHYRAVDVADASAVRAVVDDWRREARPVIRGVMHAAGTTADSLLTRLVEGDVRDTMRPKLGGALALDAALPDVETMVLFSSVATIVATPGQGAYAAANAFLDAFARRRNASGRRTVSISWGVWSGVGFGAGEGGERAAKQLSDRGIMPFSPEDGVAALGEVLRGSSAHALVVPADWSRMRDASLVARLAAAEAPHDERGASRAAADALGPLRDAPVERRREMLEAIVARHAGSILKLRAGQLDLVRPLGAQGFDSLMGLELRARLERELSLALSATLIWNYPTARALAAHLAERLEPATAPAEPEPMAPVALSAALDDVSAMSDDDVLAALRAGGSAA